MKRLIVLLALPLCEAWAGQTYYVRLAGNDANSGTSWANAWQSSAKVQSTVIVGDTVLFGAGTWYGVSLYPPDNGTSSTWTVYACSTWYEGSTPAEQLAGAKLTKLYGGTQVSGWADTTLSGGSVVWKATWNGSDLTLGDQCNSIMQGDSSLVPVDTLKHVDVNGEFYYSAAASQLYVRVYGGGDPDNLPTPLVASSTPVFLLRDQSAPLQAYIRVWGLDLRNGTHGTVFGDAGFHHVEFEHCHIAHGGRDDFDNGSPVYFDHTSTNGYKNVLRACSLGWGISRINAGTGTPPGSGLRHGSAGATIYGTDSMLIESCYVYGFGRTGFHIKEDQPGTYPGNVLRYNTINFGTDGVAYAENFGIAITVNPIKDSVYGNVINGADVGFEFTDGSHVAQTEKDSLFVCNNTVYGCVKGFVDYDGDYCGEDLLEHVLKYNVFSNNDQTGEWTWVSFRYGLGFPGGPGCQAYWDIDSNIYFDPEGGYRWDCSPTEVYQTWGYWQDTCGHDLNGDTTNPGFEDPANGDFRRLAAANEMNRTYGGRTWTIFGAVQNEDTTCPIVTQISPVNGDTIQAYNVNIIADFLTDAAGDDIIATLIGERGDASPEDTLFIDTIPQDSSNWTYNWSSLSEDSTYYWRIIARDTSCADTSPIWNFLVDSIPPAVADSALQIRNGNIGAIRIFGQRSYEDLRDLEWPVVGRRSDYGF